MVRLNSTFLKVNQGDIGFGHLENTTSWKHLDDFSNRNQFFTLRPSNVLIFPASVKLIPHRIGKGHDVMYRSMYVSTTLYVSSRIEATIYYLYVGIVRLGKFTSYDTGSEVECYFYSV